MIIYLKSNTVLAAVISIVFYLPVTIGMPYSITDNRARNLDTTPVLGRGYNIGTNSFQSTCLLTEHTTTPSYNYDCTCLSLGCYSLDTCISYILTNLIINVIVSFHVPFINFKL